MSKHLEFIFDFGSPNAYMAYKALPPMLDRTGATLTILPCLLGGIFKATNNQAPWMTFANVPSKMEYERLEMMRFIRLHALTRFKLNPNFPVNTLLMMRGAVAADQAGQLETYIDVGLTAMWEDGLKMDDPDVFVQAMTQSGLDGENFLRLSQDPEIKAKLIENTENAIARGCFGVPTFYVGEEMFFGKDRLAQIERSLAS